MIICKMEKAITWQEQCRLVRVEPDKIFTNKTGKTFSENLVDAMRRAK